MMMVGCRCIDANGSNACISKKKKKKKGHHYQELGYLDYLTLGA